MEKLHDLVCGVAAEAHCVYCNSLSEKGSDIYTFVEQIKPALEVHQLAIFFTQEKNSVPQPGHKGHSLPTLFVKGTAACFL